MRRTVGNAQEQPRALTPSRHDRVAALLRDDASAPDSVPRAASLETFAGLWVALGEAGEVLGAAASVRELVASLVCNERRASGIVSVPSSPAEAEGVAPL